MALTGKQEAFCQAIIKGKTQADAYRENYSVKGWKESSIHCCASQLASDTKVAQRLESLRAAIAKRHELTVDDIIAELEEAREMARSANIPNPGVMVNATMGKAKVAGLIKDKHELTGKDGAPIEVTRIERVIIDTKK